MDVLAFDIGGSSIKRGVVTVSGDKASITHRFPSVVLKTRSFAEVRENVLDSVAAHAQQEKHRPVRVAISTSGAVDKSGFVINSGHFEDYRDVDWRKLLTSKFPNHIASVVTTNDGKAATWAEYQRVGRGNEVFVHFVIGTGVGGGIVCFNRLLYGDDESAGALGHMKVGGPSTVECSCGRTGCVETLAAGPAIVRAYLEFGGRNKGIGTLAFDDIFDAARSGDQLAIKAFSHCGRWLGVALSNVINVLNPRRITIGGGVMQASMDLGPARGGPYLESAIASANELAFEDVAAETAIEPAAGGNDGGLLGAALLTTA